MNRRAFIHSAAATVALVSMARAGTPELRPLARRTARDGFYHYEPCRMHELKRGDFFQFLDDKPTPYDGQVQVYRATEDGYLQPNGIGTIIATFEQSVHAQF